MPTDEKIVVDYPWTAAKPVMSTIMSVEAIINGHLRLRPFRSFATHGTYKKQSSMLTLFEEGPQPATGLTRTLAERLAPLKEALQGLDIPDIFVGPQTLYDFPPNALFVQSFKFNGWIREQ